MIFGVVYNLITSAIIFASVVGLGAWAGLPIWPVAGGCVTGLIVCWLVDPSTRRLFRRS